MTQISPFPGFGLGLRRDHYAAFQTGEVPVDFVEIISENFMVDGRRPLAVLDRVRASYPVAMHGVSMSIGAADGLNRDYLARLKALAKRVEPLWVSDHSGVDGLNSHDLLPLPYTVDALDVVCGNIAEAQEVLERAVLFENTKQPIYNRRSGKRLADGAGAAAGRMVPLTARWSIGRSKVTPKRG